MEADSGIYHISCENDVGKGQETLELVVNPATTTATGSPKAGEYCTNYQWPPPSFDTIWSIYFRAMGLGLLACVHSQA